MPKFWPLCPQRNNKDRYWKFGGGLNSLNLRCGKRGVFFELLAWTEVSLRPSSSLPFLNTIVSIKKLPLPLRFLPSFALNYRNLACLLAVLFLSFFCLCSCHLSFLYFFILIFLFNLFFLSQNVIYELINTEQVYMDDLSATLEVSIRVECEARMVLFTNYMGKPVGSRYWQHTAKHPIQG